MKHAGSVALDSIEPVLCRLRNYSALREKKRGVFYRASRPFLHFHEDAAGMFADLKETAGFRKRPIGSAAELERFYNDVESLLEKYE